MEEGGTAAAQAAAAPPEESVEETPVPATLAAAANPAPPPAPSPLSGGYLLIVIGEPHCEEHTQIILQRLAKGFLSWNADICHVDLEKELSNIASQAPEGEEARSGERLIQFASESLVTEVLIQPQTSTLLQCTRNLLSSFTRHRHIIHAGYTFAGSGSWALQDGTFSVADFLEALQEPEAQRVIRAYENSVSIDIHCSPEGDWNETRLRKEICTKGCQLRVNPDDQLSAGSEGISGFTKYISKFIKPAGLEQLLEPSDVVGNIRFSHPTLYVFPGGQGDAALFGINGFNMLVDGGFSRKSCFWDFTRHLDRLDAVMVTRINNSNINGITSVLKRKRVGQVYPQIGHFFCNITERKNLPSPDGDKDRDSLLIDLLEEGHEMVVNLRQLDLKPHACYRDIVTEPINLYHKVGHGKLDLYVISPVKDSKEVKEFLIRWNNCDQKLFSAKTSGADLKFPLQNLVSICALLVWQPANPTDTITRILFPGSTPQHKIFEGLEKLKHLEFLKYPVCTARSLQPHITKTKAKILERTSPDSKIIKNTTSQIESKVAGLETKPLKSTEKSPKISLQSSTTAAVLNGKTEKKQIKSSVTEKPQEHVEKMKNERNKETKDIKLKNDIATKTETKAQIKPKYQSKPTSERKIQRTPSSEKKTEKPSSPTPKKVAESRIRSETKVLVQSKQKPKSSPTSTPAKSAKEANNRKVVESKIQATKQLTSKTTESSGTSTKITDKRYQYKKAKPSSPKKQQKLPTSPSKVSSTKSTPAQSVKSEKDGVIKVEKIVALTNVIADDSQARSTDTTGDNNIEDNVSIKAEETDVLQAEYPLEDMCASQDKIDDDIELRDATVSDDGALEADLKECDLKSEDTDEMKRDDIEDTKENISIVDSQLEEETEDDVELDKKLLDTDERLSEVDAKETDIEEEFELRSDDGENKHVRDEEESEKERKSKDLEEICERKETTNLQDQNNDDALETEEKVEVEEEEEIENELEMQVEADEVKLLSDETKEKIADEVTDIICSAQTVVATQSETKEICEDDVENKMESCTSEEKNQISSEKLRDDGTPEDEIKEQKAGADDGTNTKSQPDEKISAMETSATTAPSMPEDERIPLDEIKEGVEEKYIKEDTKEKEGEIEQREATLPITPKLPEVITSVPFDQQQPTTNQRDIVKTPDEVADLPMHEEVDATPYEIPTEINVKKKVEDVGEEQDTQERELEIVESHRIKSESEEMMLGVVPIVNEDTVDKENEICTKENIDETNMKSDTQIPIQQSDLENGCNDEKLDAKYTSVTNALDEVKIVKTENVEVLQNLVSHADEEDVDSNVKETVLVDDITLDHPNKSLVELSAQVISETALPVSPCENKGDKSDSEKIFEERNINTAEVLDTTITAEIANETVLEDQSKLDQTSMPSADLVTNATSEITSSKDLNDGNEEAASHISELKREIINTDKEADTHLFDDVTTNIDNKHQIPSVAEHFVEKDQVVDENVSNKFIEKVEESIKHEPIVAENEKNEIANVELLNEDITTETDTVTPIKETEHMRCEIDATLDQKGIENIMTEDIKSEQILTEQNIMIDVTPEEKVAEKLSSSTIEYQTSIIPGKGLGDSEYASESEQVNQYDIPSKSVFEEEISTVKEKDKYEAISCEQEIVNKQSTTSTDISETSDAKKVIHIHDDDTASSSEGGKLLQEEIVEEHSISTTILNENIVTVQSSVNNMDDKQLHEKDDISDLNLQGVEITRQETIKTAKEETTDISQDSIVIESKEISTAEQTNELEKKLVQQFDETKDKQPDPCIIDNIMVNENEKQLPIDTEKIGGFSITPDTEITKISEGLVRVEEIACKEDIDACVDVDAITVSEKTSDNATITATTMTQNTVQLEIESQLKDSTPVISKADTQKDTVNDLEGVARDDIPDNALEIDQKCEAISSHKITCEIAAPAQGIIINESLSTEVKDVPITDFEESVDAKIFTAEHIHKKSIDCHNVHGSESSNQNAELENITLFQTEATKESRDDLLANETTLLKSQEAEKDLGKEFDSELESELDKKLELSTETSVLDKLSDKNPSVSLKYDTIPDNSIEVDSKKTEVVEDKSPFVSEEQSSNSDGLDTKETRILEISPNEERVATETNNVAVEEIKEQCLIQSAQAAENFIPILSSTHESERSKETAFDSDEVRTANNELDVTSHLECDIQDTVIESDTYEIENDEKIQYSADESNKLEIGEINQAKSDEDIRREEISADVKTVISDSLACLSDQMSSMTSDRTDVSVIEADAIENVNENQDICVVSSSEFGSIPKENKDDENEVGKTIIESHSPLHENLTDKITYEAEPITSDEPKDDTDASTGKNIETDLLVTEDKFSQESNVQSEVTQEVDSRHQSECKLSTYESTEYHGDLGAESLNISNVEVYEDERATNDLPTPSLKTDDAISHTSQLSLSSTVEDEKCDSQDKEIKTSPQNGVCSTTDISNAAETYITKEEDIISKLRGVTQDDSLKLCSSDDITKPEIECVASYEIDAPKTDNFESIKNTDVDNKFVKQDKITHGTENVGQSIGTNESLEFGLENNTQETLPCTEKMEKDIDKSVSEIAETMVSVDILEMELTGLKYSQSSITETAEKVTPDAKIEEDVDKNVCEPVNEISKKQVSVKVVETELTGSISPQRSGTEIIDKAVPETSTPEERVSDSLSSEIKIAQTKEISSEKLVEPTSESTMRDCTDIIHEKAAGLATDDSDKSIVKESDKTLEELVPEKLNTIRSEEVSDQLTASYLEIIEKLQESTEEEADKQVVANDSETLGSVDTELKTISKIIDDTIIQTEKTCIISNVGAEDASSLVDDKLTQTKGHSPSAHHRLMLTASSEDGGDEMELAATSEKIISQSPIQSDSENILTKDIILEYTSIKCEPAPTTPTPVEFDSRNVIERGSSEVISQKTQAVLAEPTDSKTENTPVLKDDECGNITESTLVIKEVDSHTTDLTPSSTHIKEKSSEMDTEKNVSLLRNESPMSDSDHEMAPSTPHSDISSGQMSKAPNQWDDQRPDSRHSDLSDKDPQSPVSSSSQQQFCFQTKEQMAMTSSLYGALPEDELQDTASSSTDKKSQGVRTDPITFKQESAKTVNEDVYHGFQGSPRHGSGEQNIHSPLNNGNTYDYEAGNDNERLPQFVEDVVNQNQDFLQTSSTTKPQLSNAFKSDQSNEGDDPIEGWGKPLGLPSPAPPTNVSTTDNQLNGKGTPKKERKMTTTRKTSEKLKESKQSRENILKSKSNGSPMYFDLAYVPHNGNSNYTQVEFFKKVRARYYVFSGLDPSREVYSSLLEAKESWDDKDLEVTIIPTYDTDTLGYWVAENEEALSQHKIDLSPSASRCTINLQDHETSCSAYRLEF